VRFAVALIGDPELLILDEPTVAMDVEARRAFWVAMRRLAAEGRTLLFATHYLDEADANADRAILLARGKSSRTARRPRSRPCRHPHDPRDARGRGALGARTAARRGVQRPPRRGGVADLL